MERYFNTEGKCRPDIHYMVNLDDRLQKIRRMYVDRGKYFAVNCGRQYGKTTTLQVLAEYLKKDYTVLWMDFQNMSTSAFENEHVFAVHFTNYFVDKIKMADKTICGGEIQELLDKSEENLFSMNEMFILMKKICAIYEEARHPLVLIIDEVDSASNYQVFLDFLALLRGAYLERENRATFWSVILAGVYDIKNLKLKIRLEEQHKYNSPWNIAAEFRIDMSFSADQIEGMLKEYETDHQTGMDLHDISECIYDYTSGYPYLVSAICKLLDEEVCENTDFPTMSDVWTRRGIVEAVKLLMNNQGTLFQSMIRQLMEYPELKVMLNSILFEGKRLTFNPDNPTINLAAMFCYIVNRNGVVQVANRIFEMRLYNFFLSEEELTNAVYNAAQENKSRYFSDGKLDMKKVLEKFVLHFSEIYGDNDEKFVETYGRKFFLLYLNPIINGTGNYYIEAQTRDAKRTDVIVDYLGEQFVVELKIWRGNEYNERGETQLAEYLDYHHKDRGYMLSFNFNKNKEQGVKEIQVGEKTIVEAVV